MRGRARQSAMAVDLAAGGRLIEDMVRTLAFTAASRRLTLGGMDMVLPPHCGACDAPVDVPGRRIHLHLDDAAIAERVKALRPPDRAYPRGYNRLFAQHVRQAHEGCDFDFLEGAGGIPEPEIH